MPIHNKSKHCPLRSIILGFALSLLVACAIEILIFNWTSLASCFYDTVSWEENSAQTLEDGTLVRSFSFDEGAAVYNVYVDLGEGTGTAAVSLTDEGNAIPYTIANVAIEGSAYIALNPMGNVTSVTVSLSGLENASTEEIAFNRQVPFAFSKHRALAIFALAFLAWALRPGSRLHVHALTGRFALAAGLVLAVFFAGMALEGHLEWDCSVYDHHHQYYELAVALSQGELFIDDTPSEALQELSNPYDTAIREALGVDYRWDTAYYEGRYYVYFGVLPCLVFHLPYYLLTGGEFPNWAGIAVSAALFGGGVAFLAYAMARRWFPKLSKGTYALACLVLAAGSWMLYCCHYTGIYNLPVALSLALVVWGLGFWVKATRDNGGPVHVGPAAAGTTLVALTLLARPQFCIFGLLGLALAWPHLAAARRDGVRSIGGVAIAVAPLMLVLAFAAWYNAARFSGPFDFGAAYNLTTNDMTSRTASLELVCISLWSYLLQPPPLESTYPFFQGVVVGDSVYHGKIIVADMFGGALWVTPVLLLALGLTLTDVRRRLSGTARIIACTAPAIALIVCVFDSIAAGVLLRYFCDFTLLFSLAAVFVLFASRPTSSEFKRRRFGTSKPAQGGEPPRAAETGETVFGLALSNSEVLAIADIVIVLTFANQLLIQSAVTG